MQRKLESNDIINLKKKRGKIAHQVTCLFNPTLVIITIILMLFLCDLFIEIVIL